METITGSGYPLGFAMDQTEPAPIFTGGTGETTVVTEARMMTGHQKEESFTKVLAGHGGD